MDIELLLILGLNIFGICSMIVYAVLRYKQITALVKRYEWHEAILAALPPEKQQEVALKIYEIILRERESK